jgi:hypothetical protein
VASAFIRHDADDPAEYFRQEVGLEENKISDGKRGAFYQRGAQFMVRFHLTAPQSVAMSFVPPSLRFRYSNSRRDLNLSGRLSLPRGFHIPLMSATEFETIRHALHLTETDATSLLGIQVGPS